MISSDENNQVIGRIYLVCAILFTAITTMINKIFTNHITSPINYSHNAEDYFNHPILINGIMFFGEFSCLFIFYIIKFVLKKSKSDRSKVHVNPLLFFFQAMCDFISSGSTFFSYGITAGSIVIMLQSSQIIWTALLSLIFMKKQFYRHQILGILLCVIGVIILGFSTSEKGTTSTFLGFFICVIANLLTSIEIVIENIIFGKYEVDVNECVGFEGLFGLMVTMILIPIAQNIKMVPIAPQCQPTGPYVRNFPCNGLFLYEKLEDSKTAFIQLISNHTLLFVIIMYFALIPVINLTNQGITKYLSGTTRSLSSIVKMTIVWILCLILGWEHFIFLQFIGFIVSNLGFLIYIEILIIPYFDFAKYTSNSLKSARNVSPTNIECKNITHNKKNLE